VDRVLIAGHQFPGEAGPVPPRNNWLPYLA